MHRRLGNWSQSFDLLNEAIEMDPRYVDLRRELGITYAVTRRHKQALELLGQALELAPDDLYSAVRRAHVFVLWRGVLDTLRAVLDSVPPDADLSSFGSGASQQALLLLWERAPERLLQLLENRPETFFDGQAFLFPTALYAAWAHQMRGDSVQAQAAYASAPIVMDSALQVLPDDWRVHAARGLVSAGLGRRREALREAEWLEQSAFLRNDALQGTIAAEERAAILGQVGEADEALAAIEDLLTRPSYLTVHTLRLDPRWDPIRDDPRFQALLAKYDPPQPVQF